MSNMKNIICVINNKTYALTQVPELCGIFIYFRSEIKADEQLSGIQFRNWRVVTTLVVAFRYFCGIFVIKDGVFYGKDV